MATIESITVSLPENLVQDIDRCEGDRSEFVVEAVRREIERRKRDEFLHSIQHPHPESAELAEQGLDEWAQGLPHDDAAALLDMSLGRPVKWVPGAGWVEDGD